MTPSIDLFPNKVTQLNWKCTEIFGTLCIDCCPVFFPLFEFLVAPGGCCKRRRTTLAICFFSILFPSVRSKQKWAKRKLLCTNWGYFQNHPNWVVFRQSLCFATTHYYIPTICAPPPSRPLVTTTAPEALTSFSALLSCEASVCQRQARCSETFYFYYWS